jgi:cytochrome b561
MDKNFIKYLVDIGLLISFLGVSITGIIKFRSFLGFFGIAPDYASLNTTLLRQIHDWTGIVMVALVLVHLILNWSWIVSVTKDFFTKEEDKIS